jgi:predicted phage tail protein
LTAKPRAGVTPTAGSALAADAVSLEVDTKNLPPGTYRASVRFFNSMGANSPTVAVTLRVLAAE